MDNLIKVGGGVKYTTTDIILSDKSTYNEPYKRKTTIKGNIKGHKFLFTMFANWQGNNGVDSYVFSVTGGSVTYRPKNYGTTVNYIQSLGSTSIVMSSGVITAADNEVSIIYSFGNHFPAYATNGLNPLLVALYE